MADLFDILLAKNLAGGGGGGGSAIVYTSIVDNGDNTITATDDKGVEHTIAYTVGADGKITSVTLDGKTQTVTYEGDVLVKIGETAVDIEEIPVANEFPVTVTFMNGTAVYGKVGITDGMKVAEPAEPSGEGIFDGWYDNTDKITFPYAPTEDKILVANFQTVRRQMEISTTSEKLYHQDILGDIYKTNNGIAICGMSEYRGGSTMYRTPILIGASRDVVESGISAIVKTYTYDGLTYYYAKASSYLVQDITDVNPAFYFTSQTDTNAVKAILDHYFYKD